MEELAHAFLWLDYLIETFSILIALAGVLLVFRGYKVAGALIAIGSGMHALGYHLHMAPDVLLDNEPLLGLLISLMYPGLLLLTLGICYLAFSLKPRVGA